MLGTVDPEETIQRTQQVVQAVPVLSDELIEQIFATEAYQELSGIDGIDGGEQILAAVLINDPEGRILLSGDKRFVQSFRDNLPEKWDRLSGSIISFEMCLLAIEERYGFDYLLERVQPVKQCDGSLRMAIGHEPTAETFREAMTSFNPCHVIDAVEVVTVAQVAIEEIDIFK